MSRRRHGDGEQGSAVVEFVLVGALSTVLALGVVQAALVLHTRNVLTASAGEAARYAAAADRSDADAVPAAHEIIARALSPDVSARTMVDVGEDADPSGLTLVRVHLRVPVPLVLMPMAAVTVDTRGRAVKEGR